MVGGRRKVGRVETEMGDEGQVAVRSGVATGRQIRALRD
jgi:hypothetical protein